MKMKLFWKMNNNKLIKKKIKKKIFKETPYFQKFQNLKSFLNKINENYPMKMKRQAKKKNNKKVFPEIIIIYFQKLINLKIYLNKINENFQRTKNKNL